MTSEHAQTLAGLNVTIVGESSPPSPRLVLLMHGYSMRPQDLSPFAQSMGTSDLYLLPEGPESVGEVGRAWWDLDVEAREEAMRAGARDLAQEYPPGLSIARHTIGQLIDEARARFNPSSLVIGGFSQGGMLACDVVLNGVGGPVAGLFMLSASRLALDDWSRHESRLRNVPTFVSHGRTDPDLAFAAGEALRDFAAAQGAATTWVPFEGGHEIPLVVWRELRKFLRRL